MSKNPHNKNKQKFSLIGLTIDQIAEVIKSWNKPGYRAKQLYQWIHHHNIDTFHEITTIPKSIRQRLTDHFTIKTMNVEDLLTARDGTEKYLWRLSDNRFLESVLIPEERRNTVCISSQVGCSLDCSFCATAAMGLIRNLTSGEIVEQVLQIKKLSQYSITNVVFMGMGEPFLNYRRVIQASKILGDPEGVAIANKKITISTSGIIPKIYQYTDENLPFGLAISLHAPNQKLREQIMPIAQKFVLTELLESIKYFMKSRKRNRVTFEYVLLHGINDSIKEAKQLITLLSPIRCKLNIIPCNQNNLGITPPPPEQLNKFIAVMLDAPFTVTLRKNRGEDIKAACGQLAVKIKGKDTFI